MFVAFSFLLLIQLKARGGGGVFVVVVSGMNGLFQYSFLCYASSLTREVDLCRLRV